MPQVYYEVAALESHFGMPRVRLYPEAADQTFEPWEFVYLDETTKEVTVCPKSPTLVLGVVLAPASGIRGTRVPVAVFDADTLISLEKVDTEVPDATDDLDVLTYNTLEPLDRDAFFNPETVWVCDILGRDGCLLVESIDQKAVVGTVGGRLICKLHPDVLQLVVYGKTPEPPPEPEP